MSTNIPKNLLRMLLSTSHRRTFLFSPQISGSHLISLPRFLKDRISKLGNVVEAFTHWNEWTRQRAVSSNASFWVLFPDISLFAIVFNALQNILFSLLQEQCSNTVLREKRYNSLSGLHTSQRGFSESFSPAFIWWYFLFPQKPSCAHECPSGFRPRRSFKTA